MVPGQVRCYSGTEYAERPTALRWEGAWLEVERVEAQGYTPQGKTFRVRTREGQRFELVFVAQAGEWFIQSISRG
jgi:hypothetical protein